MSVGGGKRMLEELCTDHTGFYIYSGMNMSLLR